jgi:hypothetical protein
LALLAAFVPGEQRRWSSDSAYVHSLQAGDPLARADQVLYHRSRRCRPPFFWRSSLQRQRRIPKPHRPLTGASLSKRVLACHVSRTNPASPSSPPNAPLHAPSTPVTLSPPPTAPPPPSLVASPPLPNVSSTHQVWSTTFTSTSSRRADSVSSPSLSANHLPVGSRYRHRLSSPRRTRRHLRRRPDFSGDGVYALARVELSSDVTSAGQVASFGWFNHILTSNDSNDSIVHHDVCVPRHIVATFQEHAREVCEAQAAKSSRAVETWALALAAHPSGRNAPSRRRSRCLHSPCGRRSSRAGAGRRTRVYISGTWTRGRGSTRIIPAQATVAYWSW